MREPQPASQMSDLAEMVEMLLDKGIVVNADIVISVGQTEFIGVKLRAAIASFETAAKYGLEFPEGTDLSRIEEEAGIPSIEDSGDPADAPGQRTLAEELDLKIGKPDDGDD